MRTSSLSILSRVILCKLHQKESKQGKQESIVKKETVRARLRPIGGERRLSVRGTKSL